MMTDVALVMNSPQQFFMSRSTTGSCRLTIRISYLAFRPTSQAASTPAVTCQQLLPRMPAAGSLRRAYAALTTGDIG